MLAQLDLFTRRRSKRPPPAYEFAVHCMIADVLRLSCRWVWFHVPNGEHRDKATAGRLKRMGVRPGVSDFLLLSPQGRLHALELKRKGERPTASQEAFLSLVETNGGVSEWTDTFEGAVSILKRWGAVKVSV